MKELLQLMADYNIQTNTKMMKILESIPSEDLNRELGSYYGSIMGIVNHLLGSTIRWLIEYPTFFPTVEHLSKKLPKVPPHSHGELAWVSLDGLKLNLAKVDQLFKEMIEAIPESRLSDRIHLESRSGKKFEKLGGHIIQHLFNHQTHHRGAVSTLLDQLKVENDYSNLLYIDY